jgi:hypothetical protein
MYSCKSAWPALFESAWYGLAKRVSHSMSFRHHRVAATSSLKTQLTTDMHHGILHTHSLRCYNPATCYNPGLLCSAMAPAAAVLLGTCLPGVAASAHPAAAGLVNPNVAVPSMHSYAQLAVQALQWLGEQLTAATLPGDAPAMSAAAAAAEPAGAIKQQLLRQHAQLLQEANSLEQQCCAVVDQSAAAVQQDGTAAEPHTAAVSRVSDSLQAFGLAVAVQFPAAALCCNPACVNLQGASEAALLGPGSRCSGCKVARFCSKECSMAAWKAGHKAVCKTLKAAGAAAVSS